MKAKPLPSQEELKRLFSYDPETGVITSNIARGPWGKIPAGSIIECSRFYHPDGRPKYCQLDIGGEKFYFHRIIWKWMTGEDPPNTVDHDDRDICNNKWNNLRLATTVENAYNRVKQKNNTSGYKGVYFDKYRGLYGSKITVNKKIINLGRFITAEDAFTAYQKACMKYHGVYANTGEESDKSKCCTA
jgi:hypothetical protein